MFLDNNNTELRHTYYKNVILLPVFFKLLHRLLNYIFFLNHIDFLLLNNILGLLYNVSTDIPKKEEVSGYISEFSFFTLRQNIGTFI